MLAHLPREKSICRDGRVKKLIGKKILRIGFRRADLFRLGSVRCGMSEWAMLGEFFTER
jgi:hypothetical protein